MLDRGILFHPEQMQSWYVSAAHSEAEVTESLEKAQDSLKIVKNMI